MSGKPQRQTFGPAEVCYAAQVPRATFHSWAARRFINSDPGPGMGREREFTLLEAIRVVAMAKLNRLGVAIGVAAHCCAAINDEYADARTALVIVETVRSRHLTERSSNHQPYTTRVVPFASLDDIAQQVSIEENRLDQTGFIYLDLTKLAADTKSLLLDPLTRHRAILQPESRWGGGTGEKVQMMLPEEQDGGPPDAALVPPVKASRKKRNQPG